MTDQPPVEQLRATATQLREALGDKAVARVIERTIVAVCPAHDEPALVCGRCHHFDARDETLAALIASLLNARGPVAEWLDSAAWWADRRGAADRYSYAVAPALGQPDK